MKLLLTALGTLSLILGTLGIFLPVLPTTPFYLLTAWCYLKSSDRLYRKVMDNRFFGNIVRNYYEKRAVSRRTISRRTKVISISTTLLTIGISIAVVDVTWIRILLACVAAGVTWHLLSMKSCD